MAKLTQITTPAKKFRQIWQEIDDPTKSDLRKQLVYELAVTTRTVENWAAGKGMANEITRKAVARITSKITGIPTDYRHIC